MGSMSLQIRLVKLCLFYEIRLTVLDQLASNGRTCITSEYRVWFLLNWLLNIGIQYLETQKNKCIYVYIYDLFI